MDLTGQLALWADELRSLTANGLHFVKNPYDKANYERIRQISAEMFALTTNRSQASVEQALLRLLDQYTPMVMGDAIVINEAGEMLLVQRARQRIVGHTRRRVRRRRDRSRGSGAGVSRRDWVARRADRPHRDL